jgi:hypothetical protein
MINQQYPFSNNTMEKQFILYKAQDHHFDSRHYLGEVVNASGQGHWVKTPDAMTPAQFVESHRVVHSFGEPKLLATITRFWNQNPGKRLVSYLN